MSNNPDPQQTQQVAMTPEMIAAAVKAVLPQQSQQQQRQPTDEELQRMMNRFTYTPELDAQIFNPQATPEQRIAIMNQMFRGVLLEATTISRMQGEHLGQLLVEHFDEPISYAKEYGQQRLFDQAYEKAPGLKPLDKIVRQLAGPILMDKDTPRELEKKVQFLIDRVGAVIKEQSPDYDYMKAPGAVTTTPTGTQQTQPNGDVFGIQMAGNVQPTSQQASQQQAPQTRTPAGSSGGSGGGTAAPAHQQPAVGSKEGGNTGWGWSTGQ